MIWSANKFVDGAAAAAYRLGMPPLLVGMIIVGFGTSAPEIVVSIIASVQGNPGLALGNAMGSNISNIALILGITALITPILVRSNILRRQIIVLLTVSLFAGVLFLDLSLTRVDGIVLLLVFVFVMSWSIYTGMQKNADPLEGEFDEKLHDPSMSLGRGLFWLITGMLVLVGSSRLLVWGAVEIAVSFGVSDLVIGLTIVAIGTSLPELASSIAAIRKGEHDIAIGNVIGSNLFNTLFVIGLAAFIHPLAVDKEVITRDLPVMLGLTLLLLVFCYGFAGKGRITRLEAGLLVCVYVGYMGWIVLGA